MPPATRQIVIAGHGEASVNDVMADALVFEEDFEAVVEESEEVVPYTV